MIDITISDDYAVMSTPNIGFYYGYEFDKEETEDDSIEIWGFEVNDNHSSCYRISYDEMAKEKGYVPDKYDCDKCLLFGIGMYLKKIGIGE